MNEYRSDNTPVRLRDCLKEPPIWLLLIGCLLYFYRPLCGGETFFFRDLFSIFLTQKQLFIDTLKAGQLPLWDPYLHGGRSYVGNALNSTFYPTNLLFFVLPFFRAFNIIIVGHLCYALVSAYLLGRTLHLRPAASMVVAIIYGFCGYTLSLINLLNMFLAAAHLPLLVLCWYRCLLARRSRWFLGTALLGAIQVCAGSPEINILSLLLLLGWSLCASSSVRWPRRILLWGLLSIFIIGLTAIQILPQVEMLAYSSRRENLNFAAFSTWSLLPAQLLECVLPGFFGSPDVILEWGQRYWGSRILPEGVPLILSLYLSGITVMLATIGGVMRVQHPGLSRRLRLFLLIVIGISVLLSFGRYLPIFPILYRYLPLIGFFRYPIKFFSIAILPCALLAGFTVDAHFGVRQSAPDEHGATYLPSVRLLSFLWGGTALGAIFLAVFFGSAEASRQVQTWIFHHSDALMTTGLRNSFLHAFAVWGVLTLLYQYRRLRSVWWQSWLIAGLLSVDLLAAGQQINLYAPEELFTRLPEAVHFVRQEIGEGRMFRPKTSSQQFAFQGLPDDLRWMYRWTLETLDNSFAAYFRLPVIFHIDFDRLAPVYVMHLKTLLDSITWEQRLPILSAAGVTIIVTPENLTIPDVQGIGVIPNWSGVPFHIYRNKKAAARVEFVTSWQEAANNADALGYMLNPAYDPRQAVILQPAEPVLSALFTRQKSTEELTALEVNFARSQTPLPFRRSENAFAPVVLQPQEQRLTSSRWKLSTPCDGWLVFAEPYYPGWQVSIDGRRTLIQRANYAFSAVFVPAGAHDIQRWYRPFALILGAVISAICCGGLGIALCTGWLMKLCKP